MTDLDEHLRRRLDQVPAPDLWPAVQGRAPSPAPRHRRPLLSLVGAGALATLVAVVLSVAVVVRSDDDPQELRAGGEDVPATTETSLPVAGPRIVASVSVNSGVGPMAVGFGSIWAGASYRSLVRIDPATNGKLATIPLGTGAIGLAVGEGAVWAVGGGDGADPHAFLMRIDPATNAVSARLPLDGAYGVAVGPGAIWVTGARDHLSRIDPVRMEVQAKIAMDQPIGVAATADAVWVTRPDAGMVERVDPSRNVVTASIATGRFPGAVAIGTQSVWVGNGGDGTVSRLDPATSAVRSTLRVGGFFQGLVDDGAGTLWVVSSPTPNGQSTIVRVDIATGKWPPPLEVGKVRDAAFFGGALWVADGTREAVLKVQ
jgi:hypothetical protein